MAIDPNVGFEHLVQAWDAAYAKGLLNAGQGYWHAGNTLDTYVTYLVTARRRDAKDIVAKSYPLFTTNVGTPAAPGWWRDDYGWWAIAFLNAGRPEHASVLGLDNATRDLCFAGADTGWQIMNYDWEKGGHTGVKNDPDPTHAGVANTITNSLFLMLALRRYEILKDAQALGTARDVFDWFWSHHRSAPQESGLLNSNNLVRETPGASSERAWTGDQGWFWRAIQLLADLDSDSDRKKRIATLVALIEPAVDKYVFVDGVVRELPFEKNYDIDYATGPGVFMRQYQQINVHNGSMNNARIRQSAQGAWDNAHTAGCWYPGTCVYQPSGELWHLTLQTSAQDAYNAYMSLPQ